MGKKAIAGLLLVLGIVAGLGSTVLAAEAAAATSYTCTISQIGGSVLDTGSIYVRLTDGGGAFTDKPFKIPEGRLNQILAILLTAASNGSTVAVTLNSTNTALSTVYYKVE
jgi:hypothetical protein